ncbi:MAG TPA: class I SAM-dependent methyltransferase [Myxococcota bacterium]|nr:class I SAM-dependent methyltransferase [Myxococcota bacterium]
MQTTSDFRADFDRLALVAGDAWDHNLYDHRFLLSQLPMRCGPALEVGCGAGAFSRLLAARCAHVLGLDLSPEMIRRARERTAGLRNVAFRVEDASHCDLPGEAFDCVASIATLHHLPAEPTLLRLHDVLAPGGVKKLPHPAGPVRSVQTTPTGAVMRVVGQIE